MHNDFVNIVAIQSFSLLKQIKKPFSDNITYAEAAEDR